VTRMMASVGSWMVGSGTFSTRTSRFPCQVSAFTFDGYPAVRPPNRYDRPMALSQRVESVSATSMTSLDFVPDERSMYHR